MNKVLWIATMWAVAILVSGCATNTGRLIFAQSNTAGIDIGTSASTQGADFVLGYKGMNLAIVPVTVSQSDGSTEQIGASATKGHSDALSTFGQFSINSNTDAKSPQIGLGKFFATGQAAKRLADGYAAKFGKGKAMPDTPDNDCFGNETPLVIAKAVALKKAEALKKAAEKSNGGQNDANNSENKVGSTDSDESAPTSNNASDELEVSSKTAQKPKIETQSLIFAEHVNFGLVLSGSVTEGGGGLSLGYKDKDVAVVPVVSRQQGGDATTLLGETAGHFDALSVLGQFGADVKNDSAKIDVGLGKFFATGMAAKTLADGFANKLCREYTAPAK